MASSQHVDAEEDMPVPKTPKRLSSANQQTNGKDFQPPHIPDNIHEGAPSSQSATKPSILKRVWAKLGLSGLVVMIMVKPAIAATISMAIFQRPSVAAHYLNFGYLIIIISITTVPILPRGKFLLNLFLSLVSSLSLLFHPLRLIFPSLNLIFACILTNCQPLN